MSSTTTITDRNKSRMYRNRITTGKFILACASCGDFKGIPRKMEKHLIDQHIIHKDNSCPWCLGEYIWPTKRKKYHWQHFENCFESYKKLYCTSDVKYFNNDLQKKFWNQTVKECKVSFKCPRCQKLILPKKMEDHFKKLHYKELNVKKFCVFCNGEYEGKDVNHLTKCFDKQFILFSSSSNNTFNNTTTTINDNNNNNNNNNIIFDMSSTCEEMDMFGRQKLPNLDERAYKHLFLPSSENIYRDDELFSSPIDDFEEEDFFLPCDDMFSDDQDSLLHHCDEDDSFLLPPPDKDSCDENGRLLEFRKHPGELGSGEYNELEFRGNVEIARQCLSYYNRNYYKWYHIMVRGVAFNKFCKTLDKYCQDQADYEYNCNSSSTFFILPFWCWCDGGKDKDLFYRHHRHMILATRDASFMTKVWKNIVIFKSNNKKIKCKLSIPIKTPWHLVNTIYYVSNRRSRCNISNESAASSSKNNHFCIGTSLPKCFKLCMASVTKNGFQYFFSERCGKYSVVSFVDRVTKEKGKWVLLVKFLNDILKIHEVLPVAKIWKLDKQATTGEAYIYAPSGNKIFFKKGEESLPDDEWKQMQIENGNVFLDAIEEEYWIPPLSQQKIISLLKNFTEKETKKVAEEMNRLKSEYREKMEKKDEEMNNLRSQIDNLKNGEIDRLKSEYKNLKEEYKKLLEEYKKLLEEYKKLLETSKFSVENMYLAGQNNYVNSPKHS